MFAMHIITLFFPIFLNFQSEDDEKQKGGEEEEARDQSRGWSGGRWEVVGVVVLKLSVFALL